MLGDNYLPKGTLANPVSNPIELLGCDHWLIELVELVDDMSNYVLLVLQKRIIRLSFTIVVLI